MTTFSKLRNLIKENFAQMTKDNSTLFVMDIGRDEIWETYLHSFSDPVEKQGHNCNCCKSFLRQYGGIVIIDKDYNLKSIFDINIEEVDELYKTTIDHLSSYIHSSQLPIRGIFLNTFSNLGTLENYDSNKNIKWNHFQLDLPKPLLYKGAIDSIDSKLAEKRDIYAVFSRGLHEIKLSALQTTLDLIDQNSLYRGKEFEGLIREFMTLKKEFDTLEEDHKGNFAWLKSTQISPALARLRNSAIGTLLIDLSADSDLDASVGAYERIMAPSNYKRPTALITPKMIQDAQNRLTELGLVSALDRRFAIERDIDVNNLIFVDRSSEIKDLFKDMIQDTLVNPKQLTKVEEVSIEDFINKVLPTVKSIEACLENIHLNNFVSLLTEQHPDSGKLFKWDNPFSWSYTGGITDSMKERVKSAGGNVEGVLRFSIQWNEDGNSIVDLDAHALEPNGNRIFFGNKGLTSALSGKLDVDMINPRDIGVENIVWSDLSKMKEGVYKMIIHNYNDRHHNGFKAQIEFNGQIHDFAYNRRLYGEMVIADVIYSKSKGFEIKPMIDSTSNIVSKDKWGIKTNQFIKVKSIMNSPNYWNNPIGNKHYLFMLENCISDEKPKPFFNEFLKEDLAKDRKVFEVMSSKLTIPEDVNQLSGIGFSETQRNHLLVRVDGNFKRNLKIKF
jgi:hypothetical protein